MNPPRSTSKPNQARAVALTQPSEGARSLLVTIVVVASLALVLHVVSVLFGEAPLRTLRRGFEGTWGTAYGFGQVVFKATPLLFTGLAFQVGRRAGLFNIGAEGQLAFASLVVGMLAAALPNVPAMAALPVLFACAAAGGGAVAAVPGVLRARFGVSEVIVCILCNRIVEVLLPWVLSDVLGASTPRTGDAAPGTRLLPLGAFVKALEGSAASVACVLAVGLAAAVLWLQPRSVALREMRLVGLGPEACEAEGIDVARRRRQAFVMSGAIAGLASTATVLGYKGYFELGLGAGAGFSGIAVALLGRDSLRGLVMAALFFGTLEQAGLAINAMVPKDAMDLLEALALVVFAVASQRARSPDTAREGVS